MVLAALLGAMIPLITFVPAAVAIFVIGWVSEKRSAPVRWATNAYASLAMQRKRGFTVTAAVVLLLVSGAMLRARQRVSPSLD